MTGIFFPGFHLEVKQLERKIIERPKETVSMLALMRMLTFDETLPSQILVRVFPLDNFVEKPVITMDCSEWGDEPESYTRFRKIIKKHEKSFTDFELLKRFDLYERAANAYAVVMTSEADGNVILKKGTVMM